MLNKKKKNTATSTSSSTGTNANVLSLTKADSISIHATVEELADCIERACTGSTENGNGGNGSGVFLLQDLPEAPFETILELLGDTSNSLQVTNRLNRAFPKTVLYKSAPNGNGSNTNSRSVDHKRSLDLSPERLEAIAAADPNLVDDAGHVLEEPLMFYQEYQEIVGRKLLPALALAIGTQQVLEDMDFHFRMLDYYPTTGTSTSTAAASSRRLAEHRDFGFITLIQATHPGLQIRLEPNDPGKNGKFKRHQQQRNKSNKWVDLPPIPKGSAIVMFGWCAKVRSNGRIPAVLHRVTQRSLSSSQEQPQGSSSTTGSSRVAAVLFVNPTKTDTSLQPVLKDPTTETRQYKEDVTVGELHIRLAESKLEKDVEQWLKFSSSSRKPCAPTPRANNSSKIWNKLWRPKQKQMSSSSAAAAAAM